MNRITCGRYVLATKRSYGDIIAAENTPESYVKGASLKRQLTEDELKRMETLLALSEANKQSRDSIGVALMNVKDYSVGIDLEKALANPGSIDDDLLLLAPAAMSFISTSKSTVKMTGAVTHPDSATLFRYVRLWLCLKPVVIMISHVSIRS